MPTTTKPRTAAPPSEPETESIPPTPDPSTSATGDATPAIVAALDEAARLARQRHADEAAARPTVHQAIVAILGELPGIGKDATMQGSGGYKYRGIETILAQLKPLMVRHGVHFTPHRILEVTDEPYTTRGGGASERCRMTVEFRFYGPAGDHIVAVTRGEAADSGDKSSNKAMTAAMKYAVLQVFAISDAGADDPDHTASGESERAAEWTEQQAKGYLLQHLAEHLGVEPAQARTPASEWWAANPQAHTGPLDGFTVPAMLPALCEWVDERMAAAERVAAQDAAAEAGA